MDILIALVVISETNFNRYTRAIEKSNLSKMIQYELKDVLQTARMQTQQAMDMGWLSRDACE